MGEWSQASRTHVATMRHGDFYHGEKSMTLNQARNVKMELETKSGETVVLKPKVSLLDGDVIDSMFMSKKALCEFYEEQMEDAYETGVMFSLHVKATMMRVSHPIVFGHAVKIFYKEAFAKHQELSTNSASTSTTVWSICTTRSSRCPRHYTTRSSVICTPATNTGLSWRWWIRPRASATFIRPAT